MPGRVFVLGIGLLEGLLLARRNHHGIVRVPVKDMDPFLEKYMPHVKPRGQQTDPLTHN